MSFARFGALAVLLATSLLGVSSPATAVPHPAAACSMHVSDLSAGGQSLTYDRARRARHATWVAATGTVYLREVKLPNGRTATYAVERGGCVRKANFGTGLR